MMNAVYQCRLCGRKYLDFGTAYSRVRAREVLSLYLKGEKTMVTDHQCAKNMLGVADFVGFEERRVSEDLSDGNAERVKSVIASDGKRLERR